MKAGGIRAIGRGLPCAQVILAVLALGVIRRPSAWAQPSSATAERVKEPSASESDNALHAPELLESVDATFPAAALEQRIEAAVVLRLHVDVDGRVTQTELVESAGEGFDEAAQAAVQSFRFKPARRGETPIASRILYRYEFRLPPSTARKRQAGEVGTPAAVAGEGPNAVVGACETRVAGRCEPTGAGAGTGAEARGPMSALPRAAAEAAALEMHVQGAEAHGPMSALPRAAAEAAALEVQVQGASSAERLRESAQAVKVVETTLAKRRTLDLGEVLARTEGVSVQRSGGLGSETRLSLHGLTDDQVRVFFDGVPLDLAGFGLGISTVPTAWLDRAEVYRGVVPIRLGTDALGGAIDLVSNAPSRGVSTSAYYSAGAFDTHQLGLNAQAVKDGFVLRGASFFDTSRNDYEVDVRVPDELGQLKPARARRFHDGYRALGGIVEAGFIDRPWAKKLLLRVFATTFDKDLQHNSIMSVPYGEVTYGQATLGAVARYERRRLGGSPLDLEALLGASHRALRFEDRSRWTYDWFGQRVFERAVNTGETSKFASDLTQWENRAFGRATLAYHLAPMHTLRWVTSGDFVVRTGEERLRLQADRIDPLTTRRNLLQLTSGLSYDLRDLSDRVENSLFGKLYLYRPAANQVQVFDNSTRRIENTLTRAGIGDAFRMRLTAGLLAKLSYEYAARLPRSDEIFGDGALTLANLELIPETSHNGNVGIQLQRELAPHLGRIAFEATGFLRRTSNMLVRLLAQDRVHTVYQNVFEVSTLGVDGSLSWESAARWLGLQANATFQDQRNASDAGPFAPFADQRVPNRPWLFANASLTVRIPKLGADTAELSLSWFTRYVHAFLPGWEDTTQPDDTNRVPSQLTHALSLLYSVAGPYRIDLALDVTNISNARVYDVLGVQKPGRAAYFKITVGWEKLADHAATENAL